MNFRQSNKDGSCDINFSDQEIEIIKKHKKLHFDAVTLKHFGNNLVTMVAQFNFHFRDELKKTHTFPEDIIEGKEPK
jgi:hypothetical protein